MPIEVKKYIDVDSQDTPIIVYRDKMPVLDTLNVTPDTVAQEIVPEDGVDGFNKVNVSAVNATIDSNIVPGNIKDGVNILGVNGTYKGLKRLGVDITDVIGTVVSGNLQYPNGGNELDLSSITGEVPQYGFACKFSAANISGNIVLNATTVNDYGFYRTFVRILNVSTYPNIASFSAPNLQSVRYNSFELCFQYNDKIKSVSMDGLTNLTSGCDSAFSGFCLESGLESASFLNLSTVGGSYVFYNAFRYTNITDNPFPKLSSVGGSYEFSGAFSGCRNIVSWTFDYLESISGYYNFVNAWAGCSNLQSLSFPALKTVAFSGAFNNMLSNCSNVTVHFPSNLQSVIGSWADVLNGFGGTNTTVLFDLPATE